MAAAEAAAARRKQESFCSLWCWFCWLADDGSKAMAMPRGTRVPHKFPKCRKVHYNFHFPVNRQMLLCRNTGPGGGRIEQIDFTITANLMTGARKRWGIDETMDLDEMGREGEDCDGKRRRMKHWIACALRHSPPLPRGHFRAHFRDNRWREGKQRRRRRMRRKSRIKTWLAQQNKYCM